MAGVAKLVKAMGCGPIIRRFKSGHSPLLKSIKSSVNKKLTLI